jgi:hypothetical protein
MKAAARGAKALKSRLMAIPSAQANLAARALLAVNLIDAAPKTVTNRPRGPLSLAFSAAS